MSNLRKKINIKADGTEIFTTANPGYTQSVNSSGEEIFIATKPGYVQCVNSNGEELFNQAKPAIIDFHNPNVDSFGRVRMSRAFTLFDAQAQYNKQTDFFWHESVSGAGASSTHLPNESTVKLEVGTVSGEKVIRQSKRYIRYQPGKSQYVAMSGVMGALKANVRQRIGIFDDDNGLFFEQDGTNLKVVRRTYVSGIAVDNAINQSSWNLDTLDGNGPSGKTIDLSKSQIFVIDFQWLGVGRCRFGFDINGEKVYCHELYNANSLTEVYMTTANLPVRYEIENTGTAGSATSIKAICASVSSESGFTDERGITQSVGTGVSGKSVTNEEPLVSIRLKPTYNGITNRAEIIPENYSLLATGNAILYKLVYNGTPNSTSWTDPSTACAFQYQTGSTTLTGGEVIGSGFIAAGGVFDGTLSESISNKLAITNSLDGTTPEVFSLVVDGIGGAATVYGQITAKQLL